CGPVSWRTTPPRVPSISLWPWHTSWPRSPSCCGPCETFMDPWLFLPFGYLFSIIIETPILLIGLSPRHPFARKLFAGIWLTACTYPIVVIVLPQVFDPTNNRAVYLLVAETFAPVAESLLFCFAFWEWTPDKGLRTVSGMDWSLKRALLPPTRTEEQATGI